MKLDQGTAPEDIPPIHVLEAAQQQDRKETENLLAGFDRPGRGPTKPSAERDFVDYYTKKKPGDAAARPSAPQPPLVPYRPPAPTVVKPRGDRREPRGMPPWLPWAVGALLMIGIGGIVAFVATDDERPFAKGAASATTSAVTASTTATITAATTPIGERDVVPPPPPPVDPTTSTAPVMVSEPTPPRQGRREPRSTANAGSGASAWSTPNGEPTANGGRKPPPRDDFIRDL